MERYYAARKQWANYLAAERRLSIADNTADASDAQVAKVQDRTRANGWRLKQTRTTGLQAKGSSGANQHPRSAS